MALILSIETSTQVCSVALFKQGEIVGLKESNDEKSHAKLLTLFIQELLLEHKIDFKDLNAIVVSKGPGSYTGLRIGVSTAKGLCYALDLPLIAINTLQSMSHGIIRRIKSGELTIPDFKNSILCPMIDARRMEVYTAFYNSKGENIREVKAEIIDENSFSDVLSKSKMIFFGDGADKVKSTIQNPNAFFIDNIQPSASDMAVLSELAYKNQHFEDVAYFEPFYLKDFIATIPKKNIYTS